MGDFPASATPASTDDGGITDVINGDDGNDTIKSDPFSDIADGGESNDTINGEPEEDDEEEGGGEDEDDLGDASLNSQQVLPPITFTDEWLHNFAAATS
ncbi:MAG: hypothetical protein AAGJ46_09045 [Planctomycetota bacterium]